MVVTGLMNTTVLFTDECEEVQRHVTKFLPKDLAAMVAAYAVHPSGYLEYVSIQVDPRRLTLEFQLDVHLGRVLQLYFPLNVTLPTKIPPVPVPVPVLAIVLCRCDKLCRPRGRP